MWRNNISNFLLKKSLDKEANGGGRKREGTDVFEATHVRNLKRLMVCM